MSGTDDDSEDFNWMLAEPTIQGQQPIAVYIGARGDIVVRQDGDWYRKEDPWIVIRPENAKRVADAIMALAVELGAVQPQRLALPAPAADPTAAERQRRHRERKRNGETVTAPVTVTPCARDGALFPD